MLAAQEIKAVEALSLLKLINREPKPEYVIIMPRNKQT